MYKNLSVLALLVVFNSGCVAEVDEIMSEMETSRLTQDQPLEDTTEIKASVNLGVGSLEISRGDSEKLYDLRIDYTGEKDRPKVDFSRSGNSAVLKVELEGKRGSSWLNNDNKINLEISPEVDIDACFTTGVGENIVDLTGLKIAGLELINGVGNTEIYMDGINSASCGRVDVTNGIGSLEMTGIGNFAFSDFNFTGGIGESTLDFSGEWNTIGDVEIQVGLGSLEVTLPDNIGVRIKSSKSFLSNIEMPGFKQIGNEYRSSNIDDAEKVLLIRLNTGIGDVHFTHK